MTVPLKFRMQDKDDLSNRADFTYELVRSLGKAAEEAIEASPEIAELKKKAKINVSFTASLRAVDLTVRVHPLPDVDLESGELAAIKKAVSQKIDEMMRNRMSELLDSAMKAARARM